MLDDINPAFRTHCRHCRQLQRGEDLRASTPVDTIHRPTQRDRVSHLGFSPLPHREAPQSPHVWHWKNDVAAYGALATTNAVPQLSPQCDGTCPNETLT
mmetsp:Transcript_8274/g.25744  ORF Transcript_8274/g.25744 Transcript_8274/m.25744 type:complete len:99 (+) Transcript_8274:42-338(+)|eukprot:scaffold321222_cov35-Tisochrysis_lutea.AAC.2